MFRFSKQSRVSLYSDKFSPVTFVFHITRDLSVLPQSWSICSSPLFVSCLQSFMFRFSKQGRVPLYLINISPVIFELFKVRDLRVLPHCSNICRNKSLFRVLLHISCRVWSCFETMLTFIPEINSKLLPIIKEDKDGRDNILFNPVEFTSVFFSKLKHENFRMFLHKILNTIICSIFCFKSWKYKRVSNLFRKHNKTNTKLDILEGDIYKHPITEVVGMSPPQF